MDEDAQSTQQMKYEPEKRDRIFHVSGESTPNKEAAGRLTSDLRKVEKEEFNNIIGVQRHHSKPSSLQVTRSQKTGIYQERYKIGNLEELMKENENEGLTSLRQKKESEPDNDKYH